MEIKKKHHLKLRIGILIFLTSCFFGCKNYLDLKPDRSLAIASGLRDLRALLDNASLMNHFQMGLGEASADNYYLTDEDWSGLNEANRNIYTWGEEMFFSEVKNSWLSYYTVVYNSNYIIETIDNIEITATNQNEWDEIKGASLFFRAFCFYNLVVTYSKAYDEGTANNDLGIPLRLTSDFNVSSVRSSVHDSYKQIIADLGEAIDLLPEKSSHSYRPSKIAAFALLSRVYLAMGDYENSDKYAIECLKIDDSLIDYNEFNAEATYPIPQFNEEVLFTVAGQVTAIAYSRAKIDTNLYESYKESDLRKNIFYRLNKDGKSYRFKGSYYGSKGPFFGLAIDEVYLNRAECLVRLGKYHQGIDILNQLLVKRFEYGSYTDLIAEDAATALKLILEERRKELVMRNIRWMDIKRLNKELAHETTIRRKLSGEIISLVPNDNRYALPLPQTVIDLTHMPQNPR